MIEDTRSDSPFPTSGASSTGTGTGTGTSGLGGVGTSSSSAGLGAGYGAEADAQRTVQRVAQKAHEAVDRMEQAIGSSSERVMDWQQEYGDMAREQVRSNPLAAVGVAFLTGIVFSKLFMR